MLQLNIVKQGLQKLNSNIGTAGMSISSSTFQNRLHETIKSLNNWSNAMKRLQSTSGRNVMQVTNNRNEQFVSERQILNVYISCEVMPRQQSVFHIN